MLVSYKWLQSFVDLGNITPEELAEKITKSGIEVEGIEQKSTTMKNIVVGHVLEKETHPNADKLNKCLVDLGEGEPVQIICGAPNVAAGQKVVVAKPGARLPGNIKIKKSKIRGEESNGMICSLQELGFEGKVVPKDYAEGIYVLPSDAIAGSDALELLNLNDAILELGLTPNRADCMSMYGVAYETAAILGKSVQIPKSNYTSSNEKTSDYISVTVEATADNPLYTAKVIKNVKIGPSPLWLQTRLMNAGIRPHNNVVDITNFILLEYGQPLHAFDYDRFGSKEIVVRRAKVGEKLTTLDDVERELSSDHLVITNGSEPVALAGVMGGANSEVQNDTTTILLESAYFTGAVVRKASKDHGLRSEASSRYEKGIDPKRIHLAAERAAALIAELAGGEVLDGLVEFDQLVTEPISIAIELSKVNQFLGTELSLDDVASILQRLQFPYQLDGEKISVSIPTRRWDLQIAEDMYEEIARIYGYDNLPTTLPKGEQTAGGLTAYQKKRRIVREVLEGAGVNQAITYSLTSKEKVSQFALTKAEPVELAMPMSEEHGVLRLSLIPHLLDAVSYNRARKNENVSLFEIGSVFLSNGAGVLPKESEHLAGALTGLYINHPWQAQKVVVDFYTVKGILEQLFKKLQLDTMIRYEKAEYEGMHPGQTANILLNDQVVGYVGKIHPSVEKQYDVKNVYVFELMLDELLHTNVPPLAYTMIPRFPSMTRDIALIVENGTTAGELEEIIRTAGGKLLKEAKVFDVYEGDKVEAGKKSVAFTLTYFDPSRTLTDEEVGKAHEKILTALKDRARAELRQ
ncbi:phenylalanine--tRNA ligase subunit beta [Caldibacillus lycopersici]|uniref:Phenylalanine--tRNA ligase beta subunit n=1 Tax=Perspicuibacillus lycopersici TaxID=1325689 RepID=A0AAE3IT64_9BACI|nr:phenylalanine--tRNA ligase subunit beta [Perspicuibacillus lycopersici]MCU9614150.1 phenylalanine--tRNA ligase subunit beta [Perspicuibacillus lycopersici]